MKKAFTLIELLIVMSVVAILVALIVPSFRGMQNEAWYAKADKEVLTLQTAIESYYRHHNAYPATLADLSAPGTSPQIITAPLIDPWKTDGNGYGYKTYHVSGFGSAYVVYSKGINGTMDTAVDNVSASGVTVVGDDIVMSNLPVQK
jgi:general secretion pathway protein G